MPEPAIQIEADEAIARSRTEAEAHGNVIIQRDTTEVRSEWAQYDSATDHLKAGDAVRMTRDGDVLTGNNLDYYLGPRRGTLDNPDYHVAQGVARADAVKLLFDGPDRYKMRSARFTTCPADRDDWYLRASTLSLDYANNVGMAYNGWIQFYGVPILYSPWLNFPLSGNRQTGFLAPSIAFDNRNGIDIQTPFYWNIAPNYDATFYPRYLTDRGTMLGAEFRYLQPSYNGQIRAERISDHKEEEDRYSISFLHRQQITPRLSMSAQVEKVSDDDYFNDFGDQVAVASQTNLPRELAFNYAGDGWSGLARWQRFQTLQSESDPVDIPYARLPQLYYSSSPHWIKGAQISLTGEYTDFSHPTKIDGQRMWVNPTITYPLLQTSYAFIKPKVGVHASYYMLNDNGNIEGDNISRVLPTFSLDSGLIFERDDTFKGWDYTQTLEPRAYYVYIPYKDQSNLPNFDSALTDFSLAQIFSENRYSGNDRINDANQITLALTTRFFEGDSGEERFNATIGQRFYFQDQRVTLDAYEKPADVQESDLLISFGGRLWRQFIANYSLQYNVNEGATARADAGLGWAPGEGRALNLRYVMNRNVSPIIEQIDISGQWPITRNWYGVARYNYSLKDHSSLEALAGLEYNAGCWALRLVAQRYVNDDSDTAEDEDKYTVTYFAMLELGGLVGLGSNPVATLRQSIPGYTDVVAPTSIK
ncbi:LPS-assembly protein LptD [Chitiniphilus eburneus]|uniref:LPS-assembly protein LptD n=1 Tax=Chitiniphilus eburneus TaxID=2571148 RepID=UPI00145EBCD0|nr:LPS-assembly protein LptD [Chitiniphilus eburneus]